MSFKQPEAGFTLVELAVVMIIIGLLLGGILKGQELIANAEVSGTVSQIKAIDAAAHTFQDRYGDFPGDMPNTQARIPGIQAGFDGDGNGRITNVIGAGVGGGLNEALNFWTQLQAADLLGGTVNTSTLQSEISGAFLSVGFWGGGAAAPMWGPGIGGNYRAGHYIGITSNTTGLMQGTALRPNQASRIDNKIDDASPSTGTIRGAGGGACIRSMTLYDDALGAKTCGLYIQIQG